MQIRRLETFDGPAARRWYDAFYAGAAADRYAPPVTSRHSQIASLANDDTNTNRHREAWGAWEGEECVGALLVETPLREDLDLAEVEVDVPPEHRGRGIGTALWAYGKERALEAGRTRLTVEVNVPLGTPLEESPGGRFALSRGYKPGLPETRLVLDLPLSFARLESLDRRVDGYRPLSWYGVVPDRWLGPLAELTSAMAGEHWDADRVGANQERLGGLGYGLVTTMIVDVLDGPAGYTTLLVTDDFAHQDDTYISAPHRGRGLATLAKARNLRALGAGHPRVGRVQTWTAEANDPMRRINERFGYRPVETVHSMIAIHSV